MKTKTMMQDVVFLNPRTCGIYKSGGTRFKTDPKTGIRTTDVDNQLLEHVDAFMRNEMPPGSTRLPAAKVWTSQVLVPAYYDRRYLTPILELNKRLGVDGISIGELVDKNAITVLSGHGSPGNDQRSGTIPYIKVSDIRGLRVNVNPTNLVPESVARRYWGGKASGINAWDLITPNRASSNIGEFAIILPGEEQVVITKEVFIFRASSNAEKYFLDPFYMLWALSLKEVREQWRRITLMQTNREDCGDRYREVLLPKPPTKDWANKVGSPFREHFQTIAQAKEAFIKSVHSDGFSYVASVLSSTPATPDDEEPETPDQQAAK